MIVLAAALAAASVPDDPGPGISEALARERAAVISDVHYDLAFSVPADRREPVQGREVVRFTLKAPHRVVLDIARPTERIRSIGIANKRITPWMGDEHIAIAAADTTAGLNEVTIEFVSGDEALNRN